MTEDNLDLAGLTRMLSISEVGSVSLAQLAEEHRTTLSALQTFHPLRLAATFAGLLTVPELQSNCIRLEALVHLSLLRGRGHRKPNDKVIARLFADFGKGRLGLQEDPAEDVFVTLIRTPRGNFRVLEGAWESAGFYLQRTLNALQLVPRRSLFDHINDRVHALLRLSDAVCERAKLARYQLGNQIPQDKLDGKVISSLSSLRRVVRFKEAELAELGIRPEHLAVFGFDPSTRSQLADELIGHSTLERYPIAHHNGEYFLLLPTAVSAAIRRYIVEEMHELGLRDAFASTMAYEYAQTCSETMLLGTDLGAPIEFKKTDAGLLAGVMTRADRGLFINFVFLADTLENFDHKGLMGIYPTGASEKLDEAIERRVDEAYKTATNEPDFREGLTVLVCCGIGRSMSVYKPEKRGNWRFEYLGAPDLVTLSWLEEFKPLSLWRLIESQERLSDLGVSLQNINGLLNLVGWARSLGGHLIPHGDMPDEFGQGDAPTFIMIQQNAIRHVRHDVAARWDPHVIQDVEGRWVNVRKDSGSLFAEDASKPFYIAEEARIRAQWPRCVYQSRTRSWWVELRTAPGTTGHLAYQRSVMLRTWLCRMVPVLEVALPKLSPRPLLWRVEFRGTLGDMEGQSKTEFLTYETALAAITFEVPQAGNTVALSVAQEFEHALFHPENIAERALVARSVEAFEELAGSCLSPEKLDGVVREIVQEASARQSHAFIARHFRDFVRDSIWRTPIKVDSDDAAWLKLGLGWRKRAISEGGDIRGRENCTVYLNATVRQLEDEVCADLRELDRRAVIMFALQNHESAIFDRDNWRRTAAAVLGLHNDKEATLRTMAEHDSELNAIFHASRLIIEFAICECPLTGGREPGKLDMSRLMMKVLMISGLGGWSAAIHWEAMEPHLRVTPLGDIHANVTFQEEIVRPYGRAGIDLMIEDAVREYAENLEEPPVGATDASVLTPEFCAALEEEFGASLDALRKFIDKLENIGMECKQAIFPMKKSELLNTIAEEEGIGPKVAASLAEFLTFKSRPSWWNVPANYDERDRFPWRFRRRLTVLRKPLLQIDESDDPLIIVAPGIMRDACVYMVGNYHRGDFPPWQLRPKMRQWAGRSRDRIGHAFCEAVAKRMRELGWEAETEVALTKLLRKGFDQNYGDVDVLAWRADSHRALLMECKDVQHRKIEGEIAEQLADFRGELRPDGRPDHLLRHLNRLDVISAHPNEVSAYVGFDCPPQIEGHLVFKHPVPMKFAWKRMESRMALHLFSGLGDI